MLLLSMMKHPPRTAAQTTAHSGAILTFELEQPAKLCDLCATLYARVQMLQAMVRGWSGQDERVRQANQATAEEQSSHGTRRSHVRLHQR